VSQRCTCLVFTFRSQLWALLLALLVSVSIRPAVAQVLYGSVVGAVTDATGGVVPNANVTITNEQTGVSKDGTTDTSGRYSFVNVLPGKYDLKVTAPGFRSFTQTGFDIRPVEVDRVDVKLEVGQVTEQVTVQGAAEALQTEKADTHGVIETKEITSLPLSSYRNYQTLINLVPGSTPAAFQNSITDTPGRALQTHINGGNAQTNITRIDGATSVNVWLPHHVGYVVPEEAIDVVNITTGSADAEQGMAGTASITLVTKSGTNALHGSAYEFHDDQHLKARNFFQAANTAKPLSIYNNYGGTLGGPIKKNKLFYFVSFDGTGQRQASPGFYTVPTDAQRVGNFSASPTPIYDPQTGNPDGTGRTPFAGNIIPVNRISSIAQTLQGYYPEPNIAGAVTNNYFASGGPILDRKYLDIKMNFNQSDKESIWGKYGRMWATSGGTAVFGIAGGPGLPGSDPGLGDTLIQVITLGHTRTITPNLLLDGVVGYERQGQHVTPNDFGTNYGQKFGIPNTNGSDPLQSGFPNISISNYTGFGVPNWMPLQRIEESYTHSDNLTWTKGAHELRFGFDLVRHHLNHWQPEIGNFGPRGGLGFDGRATALNGGAAPNQFNAYSMFLLGLSNDAEKSLEYILATGREWQFGWYARDRWQVTKNLTVNIGLRYEYYPLMSRAGYGIERLDPSTNQIYMGGRGNVPMDAGISVSHTLFAPRVGLAYRMGDKTVLRTGYGINYDPIPFSRPLRGWYPIVVNQAFTASNGYNWGTTLSQGVPNTQGPDLSTGVVSLPGNVSERSPNSYIHRGYVQSWNFTLERQLPLGLVSSVGYVGQHSVHLLADYDINAGYPGSGTTGLPYYAAFGRTVPTQMWDGYLSSNYHSLQVAVNRSFSKGLMVKGAYTYSHAIDYTDDDGWASVNWNWAPMFQRNRATAGFDRTHVFQLGWIFEFPFGKGKKWAQNGVAAAVLGNWQANGIMSAYTGTPFTVTSPGSSVNAPSNLQTANQVKSTVLRTGYVGPGTTFYDPSAFAQVTAANTFGTSGRNILRNPGVWNTDLDVTREFPIKEKLRLQFRAEFFNFANTSHFNGVASSDVTSGSFMLINSSFGERQIRFALRLAW
jgi:hypothetical protein